MAESGSAYIWAITIDDKAAGSIGIFRKDNIHHRTAEIGYYLTEPFWGKSIVRIYAEPFANNSASCRVLEKAGFLLEGILRKNAVKNGKIIDMKMYALYES